MNDVDVVEEPVEDCRGQDLVPGKDLRPVAYVLVGGEDDADDRQTEHRVNLEPIRRHPALAVQGVEEPQSNNLDNCVSRYRTKRPPSLVVHARESLVGGAAGMGNLSDKHCLRDIEITHDDVDIGIVVLRVR
jgi:hypothetical protein